MGYLSKGYYLICLSPIIALVLFFFIYIGSLQGSSPYVSPPVQTFLFEVAIPVIAVQIGSLSLCLLGSGLHESMHMGIVHEIANIILLLWGMVVTWYSWFAYGMALSHPQYINQYNGVEAYASIALIGLLWIVSGIFFIYLVWRSSKVAR